MRRHNVPHEPGHPLHEAWLGHHGAFGHFGPGRPPFPPLPPGPWGHRGRGRGHGRRGRGDVRAAILALLAERPMHGYEMIQELEARTGGVWRPSPGSVYPTLQLLEDEGLIAGEEGEGRRRFTLTDTGRAEAERQGQRAPWEEVTAGVAPAAWNLRDAIAQTAQAAWSVGSAGSEAQQGRALEVLNDARRRLYAILAEDDQAGAEADADDDDEAEA
ncbi:MAG TPA: PadR family transcriptional regulator [Actinomycetota bacterium]|nr:PadR family transcriptional regulator [Actinomycetota bacterium]